MINLDVRNVLLEYLFTDRTPSDSVTGPLALSWERKGRTESEERLLMELASFDMDLDSDLSEQDRETITRTELLATDVAEGFRSRVELHNSIASAIFDDDPPPWLCTIRPAFDVHFAATTAHHWELIMSSPWRSTHPDWIESVGKVMPSDSAPEEASSPTQIELKLSNA